MAGSDKSIAVPFIRETVSMHDSKFESVNLDLMVECVTENDKRSYESMFYSYQHVIHCASLVPLVPTWLSFCGLRLMNFI